MDVFLRLNRRRFSQNSELNSGILIYADAANLRDNAHAEVTLLKSRPSLLHFKLKIQITNKKYSLCVLYP